MQHSTIKGLYQVAWSDAMVAWMHIKAMRIFVESVLRFGMPPSFATFAIALSGGHSQARKVLADILGKKSDPAASSDKMAEVGEEGDEYFDYVSLSFTPFTGSRT